MIQLAPRTPVEHLPPNEHNHARFIDRLLLDMGRRCEDLKATVLLFDDCRKFLNDKTNMALRGEEFQIKTYWLGMAARESATTIFRFNEAMGKASNNLGQCPTLKKLVDHKEIRNARKAINRYFPNMEALRHTAQHAADIFGSPESFAKHAAGPENFMNHIDGYTIKTFYQKKHVSWDVTDDVVYQLREVRDLYWAGYIAANPPK